MVKIGNLDAVDGRIVQNAHGARYTIVEIIRPDDGTGCIGGVWLQSTMWPYERLFLNARQTHLVHAVNAPRHRRGLV